MIRRELSYAMARTTKQKVLAWADRYLPQGWELNVAIQSSDLHVYVAMTRIHGDKAATARNQLAAYESNEDIREFLDGCVETLSAVI